MFSHIDGRLYHSKIFHSIGDVTIVGEGLQILTYARHLWQLSSKGSLACHTYCDTGHLIIMVKSEDPSQSRLMPSIWHWICHYLVYRLRGWDSNTQPSACGANSLTHCATATALMVIKSDLIGMLLRIK